MRLVRKVAQAVLGVVIAEAGTVVTLTTDPGESLLPEEFTLEQNYTKLFNASTTIRFQVPEISLVRLKVYDALGREIATLANEEMRPGSYKVKWNAAGLPSGVYYYRLDAGMFKLMKKMALLK